MTDDELAAALRALGHPARLAIMRTLAAEPQGDCCCGDVGERLPLAQSTVSQHIKVLFDAGLIARHARGTRNCYTVRTDRLAALNAACGGLFFALAEAPEGVAERSTESA